MLSGLPRPDDDSFLGEVDCRQRDGEGGGIAAEGEDIQIVVLPFREAMDRVARGEICDAKTVIALEYLALLRAGSSFGSNSPRHQTCRPAIVMVEYG